MKTETRRHAHSYRMAMQHLLVFAMSTIFQIKINNVLATHVNLLFFFLKKKHPQPQVNKLHFSTSGFPMPIFKVHTLFVGFLLSLALNVFDVWTYDVVYSSKLRDIYCITDRMLNLFLNWKHIESIDCDLMEVSASCSKLLLMETALSNKPCLSENCSQIYHTCVQYIKWIWNHVKWIVKMLPFYMTGLASQNGLCWVLRTFYEEERVF